MSSAQGPWCAGDEGHPLVPGFGEVPCKIRNQWVWGRDGEVRPAKSTRESSTSTAQPGTQQWMGQRSLPSGAPVWSAPAVTWSLGTLPTQPLCSTHPLASLFPCHQALCSLLPPHQASRCLESSAASLRGKCASFWGVSAFSDLPPSPPGQAGCPPPLSACSHLCICHRPAICLWRQNALLRARGWILIIRAAWVSSSIPATASEFNGHEHIGQK